MKKLYRSRRNKMLTGLTGGLSEMMNVDATLLRVLLVILIFFSSGTFIFIYIIAAMVVPKEPPLYGPNNFGGPYGGGGNYHSGGGYNGGFGPNTGGSSYSPPPQQNSWGARPTPEEPASGSQFDSMMDDLEKKALRREIEELKSKLSKQEKGE